MRKRAKSKKWEVKNSSLGRMTNQKATYDKCREYACTDITSKLTHIKKSNVPCIVEIPANSEFHFIGRVNTKQGKVTKKTYYETFEKRNFVGFSTISNRNISRYKGEVFFVYDIYPDDIVHIFPADSDTKTDAENEQDLTYLPSLWLDLQDLESITNQLKVYNQITCKTKRNGEIIKPIAILAIEKIDDNIQKLANEFETSIIVIHPDEDAITYTGDLLYDKEQFNLVSRKIELIYGIDIKSILHMD